MDGLGRAVGNGITGLVAGAFDVIGSALRGIVGSLNAAVPYGLFPLVVFVVLVGAAWVLAKR
jgi:Flp pilus assembly pilin Flp